MTTLPTPPPPATTTNPTPAHLDRLLTQITAQTSLYPTRAYLQSIVPPTPHPPEPALLASLRFRVLSSDITQSLSVHSNTCFPANFHTGPLSSTPPSSEAGVAGVLAGPIAVQVIDIWDMGTSSLEQLERLEEMARGEVRRGMEVIRVLPPEPGEDEIFGTQQQQGQHRGKASLGPHKVLLEDAAGRKAYGFEMEKVGGLEIGGKMKIGAKLVLRNVPVSRQLLLLQPSNTTFLGGSVAEWNQKWVDERMQRLKAAIGEKEAVNSAAGGGARR